MASAKSNYRFPKTDPNRRPPIWWHVAWVVYANRHTFIRGLSLFAAVIVGLFLMWLLLDIPALLIASIVTAVVGVLLLANSLIGLTLVYGPPARNYIKQLLALGGVTEPTRVADLHIGTYRISYILADLLPSAEVESVDIWDDERYETERALVLLRELESVPMGEPRVRTHAAVGDAIPLPEGSCDVVILGLGLHEIPEGGSRDRIFAEAKRALKPGGQCLFFEHTVDLQSLLVFGTGMYHWVRREEWLNLLKRTFGPNVRHRRSWHAVNLFAVARVD